MFKRFFYIIISLTFQNLFAQEIILAPHPVESGTRFSFSQAQIEQLKRSDLLSLLDLKINSIAVAGSFNQWKKDDYLMVYDSTKKIWFIDINLKPGIEYHYKFVVNDSIWITDPNAPDVTEDE
ncbi:MAG: hypothetical protein ACPL25_05305, partial [Ignavibacteria bacterium]